MELTACLAEGESMPRVECLVLPDNSVINGLLAHIEDRPFEGTATFYTPRDEDDWGDDAPKTVVTFRGTTRAECVALCAQWDEMHYRLTLISHYIEQILADGSRKPV